MTPIKFYRTESLPELGEIGSFYFLHGDSNSLYVCTDTSGDKNQDYENYSGHTYWESENGTDGGSGSENDPTDSPLESPYV